jgi:hypothetical protein
MATSTTAPATQPYTVIGYWDDSDTAIAVGVVEGSPGFAGSSTVSEGGPWAIDIQASSYEEAETLGTQKMQADFDARAAEDAEEESDEDDEDDDESNKLFEFEHNDRTYEVDAMGESYTIYRQSDNANVIDFEYHGDEEAHDGIEEAAIKALEALGL